jgi:cytochrome c oxidase subunit 3
MTDFAESMSVDPFPGRPALAKIGMMIFLASDLMLFSGLFAANFLLRSRTAVWPPAGVKLDLKYSTVFTVVLVASSVTLQLGVRAFERRGDVSALRRWTGITVVLGIAFLVNQFRDYAVLGFSASDHAYGSVYWTLTGLHAFHVTVGVLLLVTILIRSAYPTFDQRDAPAATSIGYFWHFVDAVWVAVYATIFLIQ